MITKGGSVVTGARVLHTPGPWRQDALLVTDNRGIHVAYCTRWDGFGVHTGLEVAAANAAFIVRACNTHNDLIASCRDLLLKVVEVHGYTDDIAMRVRAVLVSADMESQRVG